jgi:PAS domain S-box-containing protein
MSVGPSEEQFRLLVASVKDYAIFMLDRDGRVKTWNAGAEIIKGYHQDEIVGRPISVFYTPEDLARGRPAELLQIATVAGRVEDEGWRVRKDGTRFWADVVITALRDPAGELVGFAKVTRDLTSRRAVDEELRQNRALLAATLNSIGDAVLATDERGRVTLVNRVAEQLIGWASREAIGRPVDEVLAIINEDTRAPAVNPIERVLREGAIVGLANHTALVSRTGEERPIADSGAPIKDAAGEIRGAVLVFRDVTDERRATDAVRRSEALLAATLRSIGDGVLATDVEARVTMINPVAERLTGWSQADALGRPIADVFVIVNEETRAPAINPVGRVLAEGIVVGLANHTALIARDGAERPIADSGAPIRDVDGNARGAVLVFRDVTEDREAEEALRHSEERLRLMIASVHDYALFMLDPTGHVISWNPGAERIVGYREDEILGEDFARFFSPEDVAAGLPRRELEAAEQHGRFEDEASRCRKDGTAFWASIVISAVRDPMGHLLGFTKILRDLTQRRTIEDERLRLAQSQEAVRLRDEFLSIASHELKSPLTALQLQLEAVRERVQPFDATLATKLERAVKAGNRLGALIEALLDVSRIATGRLTLRREPLELVEVTRETVERAQEAAQKASCDLSLEADGPIAGTWDRLRVEQMLTNLLTNAIKYAPGKPIYVSVRREDGDAVLEVSDRGPGLTEEAMRRIFGRFERATSTNYGGLGLGLYITRQIAEAHGGSVVAKNLERGGASFVVRLPMTPAPA